MAFAIMVSLLVSFTLTPMLSARWLKVKQHGPDDHSSKDSRVFHAIDVVYTRHAGVGRWRNRAVVAAVAVLVLLSSVPLFMMANKNFMPQDDASEFEVTCAPRGHQPRIDRSAHQPGGERDARQAPRSGLHASHHSPAIPPDAQPGHDLRAFEAESRRAGRDQFVVMDVIPQGGPAAFSANLRTSVQEVAVIGGGGSQNAAVQFVINGPDLRKLEGARQALVDRVKVIPGVVDVDTSLNPGKPELSVHVDRPKAADLGVQISDGRGGAAATGRRRTRSLPTLRWR